MASNTEITIPYNYTPRPYQLKFWDAMHVDKCKRAALVFHRRAGKTLTLINMTHSMMWEENGGKKGTYYHSFPQKINARQSIWNGQTNEGIKYIDAFPPELIKRKLEDAMSIELINGSIWQLIGSDEYDRHRGSNPQGIVFDEWSYSDPRAYDVFKPILANNGGWCAMALTPNGKNHAYDLYRSLQHEADAFTQILTVDDTHAISLEEIEKLRRSGTSESFIQQEFFCSFNGTIDGSYYVAQMARARAENRITRVPWESSAQVATVWDIGIGDKTAVIFVQKIGHEVRIIDFLEANGLGLVEWSKLLKEKPYSYCQHSMPHDIEVRELTTGVSRKETAEKLGISPIITIPKIGFEDGISAARNLFSKVWFDEEKCDQLIAALSSYHRKKNDKMSTEASEVFSDSPVRDWSTDTADSFRYLSICIDDIIFDSTPNNIEIVTNLNYRRNQR